MPPDALEEISDQEILPEYQCLQLPSDFPRDTYDRLGLTALADTEYILREAQAHDAIKRIRNALGLKSFMVSAKYNSGGGQRMLTRSEAEIHNAQKQVEKWKEVYQRAWKAMGKLQGVGREDSSGKLQELTNDHLIMLAEWMDEHRYWREQGETAEARAAREGQGRRELPWIWKMEFPVHASQDHIDKAVDEWTDEGGSCILNTVHIV